MTGRRWIGPDLRTQPRGASAGALIHLQGNHPVLPLIAAAVPDAAPIDALVSDPPVRGERTVREGAGLTHRMLFLTPPAPDNVVKMLKRCTCGSGLVPLEGRSRQQGAAILRPMRKWLDAHRR